ncbi:hypothetical protein [Streptomyces noursei]|uniref:hypothetical protein n=1 Tax=Streptomyces noursei TaxID=1971 RepID=UPI0016752AB0|nr:hypothetical protein [Streptomyces noursei]MCZ1019848.1 hypothetical protein [Streptomyces noursei]
MRYTAPLSRAQADRLGKDVGTIIDFAANAIIDIRGEVNTDELMRSLTASTAIEVTAARYLKALEEGHRPEQAAAVAGTALVFDWADATLETRARLQQERAIEGDGAVQ